MEKIKNMLIHWLGGYTEEDKFHAVFDYAFIEGRKKGRSLERKEIVDFAKSLYGLPADEWSKKMYEYLTKEDEQ